MAVGQLMDEISFVFQDVFLLDDTIAANIALGNPGASRAEILAALGENQDVLSELLAGLQRLEPNPPPALRSSRRSSA